MKKAKWIVPLKNRNYNRLLKIRQIHIAVRMVVLVARRNWASLQKSPVQQVICTLSMVSPQAGSKVSRRHPLLTLPLSLSSLIFNAQIYIHRPFILLKNRSCGDLCWDIAIPSLISHFAHMVLNS